MADNNQRQQQQRQNQQQSQQQTQQQTNAFTRPDDDFIGENAPIPYDMSVAGDAEKTLWDDMVSAVKPDLTPNKNKGDGVLGQMPAQKKS